MDIHQKDSADCGVREEGCRAMAKREGHLEGIYCILVVTQVDTTNRSGRLPLPEGVVYKVYCDEKYKIRL